MALMDLVTKRGKKADKLRRALYAALAPTKEDPSNLVQRLFALEGGNNAAEYLYGKLLGLKEGSDYNEVGIERAEDFVICAHIMKMPQFSGRMDELLQLGETWELVGRHWRELSAIASLEQIGDPHEKWDEDDEEAAEEDNDIQGLTQNSIDALLLTLDTPVGGNTIARLIREQHPAYSTDGWVVRELTDRIFTDGQMEWADLQPPTAVRLPSDCMGVVVCKFGVHPEFLVVKDKYAE